MVEVIMQFLNVYGSYLNELWLSLGIGFFLSGLLSEFIPTTIVERHLGNKGLGPIFISSFIGMLLPVCCFGSLPIAMTLRHKGARLGPVLAFLVATPATSVSAIIVCWKLLGTLFTLYIFLAVMVMGIVIGMVGNFLNVKTVHDEHLCPHCADEDHSGKGGAGIFGYRMRRVLRYGFIQLPKEIGLEVILGIAIASFIVIFTPLHAFIKQYLTGLVGYITILFMGLLTYVCSTASVPMADALVRSGLGVGQAMTYLLAGPITSFGALLIIKKEFGNKILGVYLGFISVLSLLGGLLYQKIAAVGM